jgi:EAL domain-containing protein (putative c-di-GMP-specific phosphodiesterase class I)
VHLDFLRAEGCDSVQGFLMSPAVPAQDFADLIRKSARDAVEPARVVTSRRARAG